MDFEFKCYEVKNSIKAKTGRLWGYMEKHGFPGIVDIMTVRSVYAGKSVLSCNETNNDIANAINAGKGYMVARLGAVEMNYLYYYIRHQMGYDDKEQRNEALRMLCFNAGFFPKEHAKADELAKMYLKDIESMDLCGAWSVYMEDYVLRHYASDCKITKLRFLEPWVVEGTKPWTEALAGKRVVVVHPFAESMEGQYQKRERLFENKFSKDSILPEMDLRFVKAVQSIGGNGAEGFESWFDAYRYMLNRIQETDFDVAVLGCGAYGLPLAAEIKRQGKVAIHLGGATQLWFGIKGKRWNDDPLISSFYNDFWISPSSDEKPKNADGVEGGCYW